MQINSISERLVFNNARRALRNAKISIDKARPMQSYLRLEQPLATNKTNYLFPIMVNQNNPQIFKTERRLNLQDSFVVSSIQFALGKAATDQDATFRKHTYLSPVVFPAYAAMGVVYNGELNLSVDNVTYLPAWDLERHLYIGETQQTAAIAADSPFDQYDASVNGFYPVEPNVVLIGDKNMQLTINLPEAPTTVTAGTRMILTIRGILAQNSTSVG